MKTYWDYSEKERSQMTEEMVQGMLDIELMEKGVLKVVAPMLRPIEPVEMKKRIVFRVDDVIFNTIEDAGKFIELKPMTEGYCYEIDYSVKFPKLIDAEIKQVEMFEEQSVMDSRPILSRNKSAKEENERAMKLYNESSKKMEDTLAGVWEDWHRCRNLEYVHKKVVDTFESYKAMAEGNIEVAEKFLAKVYTADQIAAAMAWFGGDREAVKG